MTPLRDDAAAYLDAQRYAHGLAPDSIRLYRCVLGRYARHAAELDSPDAPADFIGQLGREGLSDHYRRKVYHVLKTFFRWGRETGRLMGDPLKAVRPPILNERQKTFLDKEQVTRLLSVIRNAPGTHSARDHAAVSCLYFAGLRLGETLRLRPQDLNFDTEEICVMGKGGKIRRVPMHPELIATLRDWLKVRTVDSDWLFPSRPLGWKTTGRLGNTRLQYAIRKRYGPLAGLSRGVTPHTLRRSFATRLRGLGVDIRDIQRLLGHARIETTMSYLKDSPEGLRTAVRKL